MSDNHSVGEQITGNKGINTVSFNCTVCGKCCNSAPLMSLPELFHHENLFVGCLALRRVRRHNAGDIVIAVDIHYPVSTVDIQMLTDMANAQLYKPDTQKNNSEYDFLIMTQAMDYDSLNKCPALGENHHCAIHDDRKPAVCSMVPFDSLYPDSLQNIVLMSRRFGEKCIISGDHDDYQVVIKDRQVVSQSYQNALNQRRNDLCLEKQWWGNAVFKLLQHEVFCNPAEVAKIPMDNGLLSFSIIPVLMVLAEVSERCNARCLQYVDSQINLIDKKVNLAISRKSVADKQTTKEFRSFKDKYLKLRQLLVAGELSNFSSGTKNQSRVNEVENYLGV